MATIEAILEPDGLAPSTLWKLAVTALDPVARLRIRIGAATEGRLRASAELVDSLARAGKTAYGINTGFGHFAERSVPFDQLGALQENLIRSHACGVGAEISRDLVLALWLLRLTTILRGHSGIRYQTLAPILQLLEAGVLACVPSRGSVGASGDLAPSAHAVLLLLGEGWCTRPNAEGDGFERVPARQALADLGLMPLELGPKEGIALINGTQYTTALAIKAYHAGEQLLYTANLAAAMSMEAVGGAMSVLEEPVLATHHADTITVGRRMAWWLEGSTYLHGALNEDRLVQAPYSLRCAPQVHGAVALALRQVYEILAAEIRTVSDNPLIFPELDAVYSCGNFHAIYPARAADTLASALTTLGSIAERRVALLLDHRFSGLPEFLTREGGVNSGMMLTQVTAAALVSECKVLSVPASVDSIPTSCGREDHVSMGAGAGIKALQVVEHVRTILAIELMVAAQALDLRTHAAVPPKLRRAHERIRAKVAFLDKDRVLAPDIAALNAMILTNAFAVE